MHPVCFTKTFSILCKLIAQLRSGETQTKPAIEDVNLVNLIHEAMQGCIAKKPVPVFSTKETHIPVQVNQDRMVAVIEHIIENAQDATPPDGRVEIQLKHVQGFAVIDITDTGCGMDDNFIRNRLFRPFDSTKGTGMGIGAYESREFIRDLGGNIEVTSKPGAGTTFSIRVPLMENYWKATG